MRHGICPKENDFNTARMRKEMNCTIVKVGAILVVNWELSWYGQTKE
jgi:hypothetical protein